VEDPVKIRREIIVEHLAKTGEMGTRTRHEGGQRGYRNRMPSQGQKPNQGHPQSRPNQETQNPNIKGVGWEKKELLVIMGLEQGQQLV